MKSRCDFVFGRDDVLKQVMLVEQERNNYVVRNATSIKAVSRFTFPYLLVMISAWSPSNLLQWQLPCYC